MKKLIILFSFVFYLFGCNSEQNKLKNENPNEELTAVEYYNRGLEYKNLGKYQLAIDNFSRAIKINPDYLDAYNDRGIAYKNLGNYQLAIDDYTRAIQINPDYVKAYYNRGFVKMKLGRDYCSDYKKACELGACDNYNTYCK